MIALLSIQPLHSQAIFDGSKTIELRRKYFKQPVTHIAVYETVPTKAVVGIFAVEKCTPATWRRHSHRLPTTNEEAFNAYFAGSEYQIAIHIDKVTRFKQPIQLSELGISHPPQSFRYLDGDATRIVVKAFLDALTNTPKVL